eukprot:TRINITY_DN31830_c0_g1_i1.p1 TRINITY_DN31830_c0_g1~~TRINITY_DN31830_c0_g1_i1.p1  ORF type:complete len:669 (-),score=177.47 TRINITY_DN31830_c0_g1_i1:18-2024(-)
MMTMTMRPGRMPPGSGSLDFMEEEVPPIFAEEVPVLVKPAGRDEYNAQLTVRLRPDNVAHPRNLLLEMTDENDLLFYFSLALGEGDFHALRSEQRLLVDFQSFPEELAGLLRRCCRSEGVAPGSRMLACLDCGASGEGMFSIIESNHFRELTHIALRLRQGSDDMVKQHLAKKLRASRLEASSSSEHLATSTEALAQSRKQVEELMARARVVAEERTHLEQSLQATHLRELTELRQEHARVLEDLHRRGLEDKARQDMEHSQALKALQERARAAEASVEELKQQSRSLTATGESCQERLVMAESKLKDATAETDSLQNQVKHLKELKFKHEQELTELRVQLASSREQLLVREQQAQSQAVQIEEAVNQRRMLEESLAACRKQAQTLEEKFALSAQEIAKGNRIIQSLHNASKEAKAKLKLKASALVQQEKSMLELEKADEMSKHVISEKDAEVMRGKAREERLQQDIEEMKKKLGDAHDVIKSNQEVIEYLNRQLTEKDLKGFSGAANFQLSPSDGGFGYKGTGALATLLGTTETMGSKRTLGSSASFGALGFGTGSSSVGLGSPGYQGKAASCFKCGNMYMSDSLFCRHCGKKRGEQGMSSPAPEQRHAELLSSPSKHLPGKVASPPLQNLTSLGAADMSLSGPVAYRRPGEKVSVLDAITMATAGA